MNRKERRAAAKTGNRPANYALGDAPDGWRTRNRARFNDALAHLGAGRFREAHQICQQILAVDPNDIDALHLAGLIACQVGLDEVGIGFFRRAVSLNDRIPAIHHNLAEAYRGAGKWDEAIRHYRLAIGLEPKFAEAHASLATAYFQQGTIDAAVASYRKALALAPDNAQARNNLGAALSAQGRFDEAVAAFREAIAAQPDYAEAHCNCGNALQKLKRVQEAVACYDDALALRPDYADALHNRSNALLELKRYDEVLAGYETALSIRSDDPDILRSYGDALLGLKRQDEALAVYDRGLAAKPFHPELLSSRGKALLGLGRHAEALAAFDRALAVRPDDIESLCGRGNTLFRLNRGDEALASFGRALEIEPGSERVRAQRGETLQLLGRYEEAAADFADLAGARGDVAYNRMMCCDWRDDAETNETLDRAVLAGEMVINPFAYLARSDSPRALQACAQSLVRESHSHVTRRLWDGERYRHDKIRVAYLSADFHNHATAYLIAGLFEAHDKAQFDTTAISFGPNVADEARMRLVPAMDRFVDVTGRSDYAVAGLLKELEIDIAVDLKGYTRDARPGILAFRPAPVQVSYLGYPGTMAADFIDYIVADRFVIPEDQQGSYSEKVVYLPDSYQVNDARRHIAERTPTRSEAGLPETGFVFCSFNNSYKITPRMFDRWMRLLRQVEGSVLWLLEDNAAAVGNLRREAERRGVAPERLVFAPRINLDEHLARHRLADLALDTLPYNAHTTASDALWAGLPLITCPGASFQARVAGSLLHAIGLPELITPDLDEYEALALRLARDPAALAAIREKLAQQRTTAPLFDTGRFARHIESAYRTMWQRYQRGEPPAAFAVGAEG
jgi:predicted O-linked N-acetylglucosamine transferase (SPINDLY family)